MHPQGYGPTDLQEKLLAMMKSRGRTGAIAMRTEEVRCKKLPRRAHWYGKREDDRTDPPALPASAIDKRNGRRYGRRNGRRSRRRSGRRNEKNVRKRKSKGGVPKRQRARDSSTERLCNYPKEKEATLKTG